MASEDAASNRSAAAAGVSGFAVYVPRLRVNLESWCDWTKNSWDKVKSVAGQSFRVCPARENVYTMAANAALRLIRQYGIDPKQVGFLALGTESSRDNSAGAVIVRGMLDQALEVERLGALSRNLEVPEFKHACLGGVYALKSALRYVASDGAGKVAIVVAGDIAEYERGSTGEQTQGAGAVAMLVEREPRLFRVDLAHGGSASSYRGPDFRKPFIRHFMPGYSKGSRPFSDFPVFSGRYSTFAYLDEVAMAVDDMLGKLGAADDEYYQRLGALFFHRPYRFMPIQAMSFLFVRALARAESRRSELEALCAKAEVKVEAVIEELRSQPDLYAAVQRAETLQDPYPAMAAASRTLRNDKGFKDFVAAKMSLGSETAAHLGNLYCAALPAWIAAGLEEAQRRRLSLAGAPMAMVGYGSGDAAESIPMSLVEGWEEAARRIRAAEALEGAIDLSQEQYEGIHGGAYEKGPEYTPRREFVVRRVGDRHDQEFQDLGVEYYDYVGA